jgi:1-acyl-sn-glycerol-3-phosphate acyltransferase
VRICIEISAWLSHAHGVLTWEQFAEQMRQTGVYETAADFKPSGLDRLLGRFDWYYHWLISKQVWGCGSLAKRGMLTEDGWATKSLEVIQVVERCGGRVAVSLPEAVRANQPCVYVGNHMSVLETIILPCILVPFGHPTIVIKKDLLSYPALKHTLFKVKPIAVSRTDPRGDLKTVLKEGRASLERGESVLIFPQATRSVAFDAEVFNSLGVKLAARSKVPAVPLALKTDFSGLGPIVKEFGKISREKTVHFSFGEPLDAAADTKAAQAAVVNFITGSLERWTAKEG